MSPRDLDALDRQVAECKERGMVGTILDLTRLEALIRARLMARVEAASSPPACPCDVCLPPRPGAM